MLFSGVFGFCPVESLCAYKGMEKPPPSLFRFATREMLGQSFLFGEACFLFGIL